MNSEDLDGFEEDSGQTIEIALGEDEAGERLDKALATKLADLSRARLQALIADGALSIGGKVLTSPSAKAQAGLYSLHVPEPQPAEPEPQDLPLTVLYEDAHLIVVDKAAGMAVHPGPGTPDGTLVNALLHHCAGSLSGVGGVARPGVVHRLDKDTSGVMVAAKSDAAHAGLSALFAAHDIERRYIALTRGAPYPPSGVISTRIGRSPHDRKKMAVLKSGGREAVTRYRVERTFGGVEKALAARVACELETGRTHQIRVHMQSLGFALVGDALYGKQHLVSYFPRQALHAFRLGLIHPTTGDEMEWEAPVPDDFAALLARANIALPEL